MPAGSFGIFVVPFTVSMFVTFSFFAFALMRSSICCWMSQAITLPFSPTSGDKRKV